VTGAELVICHAGSGIISSALRSGRRPLVLPRRAQHGEHVDDHQLQLAGRLAGYGFATLLRDEITEADIVTSATPLPAKPPAIAGGALADVLAARLGVLADVAPAPAVALA
jgi:UDP-N-acetylglucosamine transferase subunit ALG13